MATTDEPGAAQWVAEQLAGVVIAALRPDVSSSDGDLVAQSVGDAVQRLGRELLLLLQELESETAGVSTDSAIARAAHLAAHITLSDQPDRAIRAESHSRPARSPLPQTDVDREL